MSRAPRVASVSAGLSVRPGGGGGEPTELARLVLDAVDTIPAGFVLTYGDVAELVGRGGPRGVGSVLASWGHEVSWWRVVLASGRPNPANPDEGLARLRAEGCPTIGARVDLARARWPGNPD